MKKFLKIVGVIILLVVIFILVAGLLVSKSYHFDTSVSINAPKEKVWPLVSSLSNMEKWSPWHDKDPNMKITYSGQDGAIGSSYSWEGNKDVGSGTQTLTKLEQPSKVDTHIHFIKPFEGEADAYINLEDAAGGTKVTWGFDTKYPYPMNVMKLFMNMDKMMGEEFNSGLSKLKHLSETNQ